MSLRPSIALIGMRGAGKTVVGRELARLRSCPHIDTDELVVQQAGRSIAEIFATHGELAFREMEAEAIRSAVTRSPAVISVGGGAVVRADNVAALRAVATIVWLTAPVELLWRRMEGDPATGHSRPTLTARGGIDELRETLLARAGAYASAADLVIDTQDGSPADVARRILERLGAK